MKKLLSRESGSVAMVMAMAFMALAIPIIAAALSLSGSASIDSRVKTEILKRQYAGLGVDQYVRHLGPGDLEEEEIIVVINDDEIVITINEISDGPGDDPEITFEQLQTFFKEVTPDSVAPDTATTFSYTITIKNQGGETSTLWEITDFLPPLFSYVPGSTTGNLTSSDPGITHDLGYSLCADNPDYLTWSFPGGVDIAPQETRTLTFSASATLPEGTYYNQVRLSYDSWWDPLSQVELYTPYTAPVTVGDGDLKCGYNMELLLHKEVTDVRVVGSGESEVTFRISVENVSLGDIPVYQVLDWMPPGFIYVPGSSSGVLTSDPVSDIDPCLQPPDVPDLQRCLLTWGDGGDSNPLFNLASGETKYLTIKARAKVDPAVSFFNEVRVGYQSTVLRDWSTSYADIVLVLDNSLSITPWGWPSELSQLKQAANEIVDAFTLNETEGRIRVGLTHFSGSSGSVVEMTHDDDHDNDPPGTPLHDGINSLIWGAVWLGVGTNIVDGIDGGAAQFSTGLGDRPLVPNLMIFITDGNDTLGNDLHDIEHASEDSGAEIIAVGVGNDVSTPTLEAIATDPDNVFYTSDFGGLLDIVDDIVAAALAGTKTVVTAEGGTSTGGTMYEVIYTHPDGTVVRERAVVTSDGEVIIIP